MTNRVFRRWVFILITACSFSEVYLKDYFTVALFEHAPKGDYTSDSAENIIANNLKHYETAAEEATEEDADLIIYPPHGLYFAETRNDIKKHLERIPNPKEEQVNPCDSKEDYSDRPILYSLSCIAKKNNMNVLGNLNGFEKCDSNSQCPEDGVLIHNANVVFDRNGRLLARYYHNQLFYEPGFDVPIEEQDPTFVTDIGKFANFIRIEIIYKKIVQAAMDPSIDAVILTIQSVIFLPFLSTTPWWEGWAITNNMTLLALSVHIPGKMSVGSGVFTGNGVMASTFSPDGISKLVISRVPKRNKKLLDPKSTILAITECDTEEWSESDESVPARCSEQALGAPQDIFTDFRCASQNLVNYTLVKLKEKEGRVKACNNGMCCKVEYSADNMAETFYLGVSNGTYSFNDRYFWAEENCFLARCDDVDGKPCSEFLTQSETIFYKIKMTANFATRFTYPIFGANEMRLSDDWTFERNGDKGYLSFNNDNEVPLLFTGVSSRPYDRDPPYIN